MNIITMNIITRQQYFKNLNAYRDLSKEEKEKVKHPHQEYYAQFVTDEIKNLVKNKFGIRNLVNAHKVDPNFNNIPLKRWDSFGYLMEYLDRDLIKATGQGYSNAGACCVLKEAALQLVKQSYVDWDEAMKYLALSDDKPFIYKGYWGIKNFHGSWRIDPIYESKEYAIAEYYELYVGGSQNLPTVK